MATPRKEKPPVLPDHMAGGPMGLGDPEDRTLRKVERDVLIPTYMRERLRTQNCFQQWEEWGACSKEKGWKTVIACYPLLSRIEECHKMWFDDPKFVQDSTDRYLAMRSDYRRTGRGHSIRMTRADHGNEEKLPGIDFDTKLS